LIGNSSAERSSELSLVQNKLRENRVRYKAQIDLFNSQADEQEKSQKVRRRVEERRLAAQAALDDDTKDASSPQREPSPIDINITQSSVVLSPLHRPPELVLVKGPSVQFAPAPSTITSTSPPGWGSNSEDEEHTDEGAGHTLTPEDTGLSDEDATKEPRTFGMFVAIKEPSIVRTASAQNEQTVALSSPRAAPLPVSLTLPASLPNGIADFTTQSPGPFNIDPSPIRRTIPLLRPKSMGHILDKQLGGKLIQTISPKEIRKVKKENYVLNVLFSAPLAWRDRSNRLHPLEMLDYGAERLVPFHVLSYYVHTIHCILYSRQFTSIAIMLLLHHSQGHILPPFLLFNSHCIANTPSDTHAETHTHTHIHS
jgi:hypothetical protein